MTAKFSSGRLSLVSPKLLQASAYFLVTVKQGGRQMRGRGGGACQKKYISLALAIVKHDICWRWRKILIDNSFSLNSFCSCNSDLRNPTARLVEALNGAVVNIFSIRKLIWTVWNQISTWKKIHHFSSMVDQMAASGKWYMINTHFLLIELGVLLCFWGLCLTP